MKLKCVLIAAWCAFAPPAFASDNLEDCTQIKFDRNRLACYDRAMGHTPSPKAKDVDKVELRESWIRKPENATSGGTKNEVLQSRSLWKYETPFKREFISLTISCREGTTRLWFDFGGLFMSDLDNGTIDYRIDKQRPASLHFRESSDNEALGLWADRRSIPFIKSMFGAEKLLMRATPYRENVVTGQFDIAGLKETIKPVREACNW